MEVVPFPPRPSPDAPVVASPHMRAFLLSPATGAPPDTDAILELADGARFVYVPTAPAPAPAPALALAPALLTVDPFVRGNAFRPLHDSARSQSAALSIAAGRRVDTGPESERLFVFLRGQGLVFDQNGDTVRFEPNSLCVVAPGEPARIWAQGPDDVLLIVFQPKGASTPRRTLASEIAKKRAEGN